MQSTKISSEINGYIVGKTIGRGTFGKVKMAIHKLTNQPVAVKFLQKEKIKDISDVQRVSRELHFLKIVRHPAIAQLYEIIQTTKMIYIIMQYAGGGEYFDYVMDEKIKDEAEAFHYFSQILFALIYLHKLKISHRDVKPQNMLLDYHKRIKLVDFGLSNMYKNNEKLSTACGSPCYASPEMIKGQDYDPQLTDVWSLGIVLYTSVLAQLPFQDQNTNALYGKIKSGFYRINKKISPELKDLLSKMINIKPENRLRLKQICDHPWYKKFSPSKQILGIQIGYENIPIDLKIVEQMQSIGFQQKKTIKYLQNNVKNQCTATYYLFLKKHFKTGKPSFMDICAQHFQKQLITPVFNLRPKRYKSFDDTKFLQVENVQKQEVFNFRKCYSLVKQNEQPLNYKKNNFVSLKRYSVDSKNIKLESNNVKIKSKQSIKFDYKNKIETFLKTRASMNVKDKQHQKSVFKNKSLSISTQKVRKEQKNLEEGFYRSTKKVKTSFNEQRLHSRHKTDFITEICCPIKKKVGRKENEVEKQKGKDVKFGIELGNLFWRKKSSISKKTQDVLGQYGKAIRRNTFLDV